ncbi:hypothetical protein E2C01_001284 [Portunus trituberculatus]|uniref:Uncharacterized protein n=1 Tax=Portunus trituberculatus TaxID=210409 RepID=A0A5B7CIX3_PORTR|nr:hypothetical protein [Portunus trituberculatus]
MRLSVSRVRIIIDEQREGGGCVASAQIIRVLNVKVRNVHCTPVAFNPQRRCFSSFVTLLQKLRRVNVTNTSGVEPWPEQLMTGVNRR